MRKWAPGCVLPPSGFPQSMNHPGHGPSAGWENIPVLPLQCLVMAPKDQVRVCAWRRRRRGTETVSASSHWCWIPCWLTRWKWYQMKEKVSNEMKRCLIKWGNPSQGCEMSLMRSWKQILKSPLLCSLILHAVIFPPEVYPWDWIIALHCSPVSTITSLADFGVILNA